jgi:hypothetical protein
MHKLPELTVSKAVAFGHATVTLPVVGIMSGVGFAVYVFTGRISFVDGLGLNLLWQFGRVVICAIVALSLLGCGGRTASVDGEIGPNAEESLLNPWKS